MSGKIVTFSFLKSEKKATFLWRRSHHTRNRYLMQEKFQIQTLHRGRFIWVLLGGLLLVGYILSLTNLSELVKILALMFCIPVLMWLSVKLNRRESSWEIHPDRIYITRFGKTVDFPIAQVVYLKNHVRSGGNLVVFYFGKPNSPLRLWRNKLFVQPDQFDEALARIAELEIQIVPG